jgi:metal-responsive CopG/Arc/MetJ family transcriptional regulator
MASTSTVRKAASAANRRPSARKPAKERVLIEFPVAALRRADKAARAAGVSRSEFIRAAVERQLEERDAEALERELEEAYKANAAFNLQILKEFEHVDREAWEKIP